MIYQKSLYDIYNVKSLNEGNMKIFSQEKKINFYTFTCPFKKNTILCKFK